MKQLKNTLHSLLALVLVSTGLCAHADDDAIRKSLAHLIPSLKIDSIESTQIEGLYEVTMGTNILYVSEDGKYMLQGHLIDINAKKDLTELKLAGSRKIALEKLGEEKAIIFKPEKSKHTVTVFTDIDCGYCRKLHSEIDQYMAEGITIQYLFFPRAGKGSESYDKAVSVWCEKDRKQALTDAKKGKSLETKKCENPIDEHMQLATDFEVRGTPMIVTEKGNVFPGYVPAKQLAKALSEE
ncbi:MAG: DsbC family protein [Methylococcaceae bacterium]|nr:DsbC family protein [Methylococcaceae bacterium]